MIWRGDGLATRLVAGVRGRAAVAGKVGRFSGGHAVEFRRHLLAAEMLDPGTGRLVRTPVDVRIDPLTGHSSRILPERGLMPRNAFDLQAFARETKPRCPFCPERIEQLTPAFTPVIAPDGHIRRGESVLFPNLHAYSSHSCVSVYSPRLHYLPLDRIADRLMADNLAAQVEYAKSVMAADPESRWASINANHMLPSGSSLFHPHLQGVVDSEPTTMQRLLAAVPAARFEAYLRAERRAGERVLGNTGRVEWLVSFAPIVPAELRAFVDGVASPAELEDDLIEELAHGLTLTLNAYAEMGFESFNLAMYGAPRESAGYPLNLRIGCRSNLRPFYRSDSTFLERLHWESAIDLPPETIAERIRGHFRG
jgi:UDPglucose--hexose-1-phosphate uridylyltransferase